MKFRSQRPTHSDNNQELTENSDVHRGTQTAYKHYILHFVFTDLPGGGCEGLKLALKKGGGGIGL